MLRKIILENFMSHGRTEIDLADGLTVLTGPNNCGKSAVVAALQILATNGRTTHVMRHGEKFSRITVETDDGHTVVWERRNKTVKYILDGEDVHRVGTSIPDSLHDLLRLDRVQADTGRTTNDYDIHFGEQKSPVFLLGETGSRAASFFASSSDASRLVEMQHRHRSNVRERKADAKRLTAEHQKNAARLLAFEPLDRITELVGKADRSRQAIDSIQSGIARLRELTEFLIRQATACDRLRRQHHALSKIDRTTTTPATLQVDVDRQGRLDRLASQLFAQSTQQHTLGLRAQILSKIAPSPPQHEVDRIQTRISELTRLSRRQQLGQKVLACCESLKAPPAMQPAGRCRLIVESLLCATDSQRQATTANRVLSALRAAPELHDTKILALLLRNLNESTAAEARTGKLLGPFRGLVKPPDLHKVDELRRSIATLIGQHSRLSATAVTIGILDRLRRPADPTDVKSLEAMIAQLRSCSNAVASAKRKSNSAKRQTERCETEVRAFVDLHPTCDTCGGRIDPETLLSSLPSGHQHSAMETIRAK